MDMEKQCCQEAKKETLAMIRSYCKEGENNKRTFAEFLILLEHMIERVENEMKIDDMLRKKYGRPLLPHPKQGE